MHNIKTYRRLLGLFLSFASLLTTSVFAIDNPGAADLIGEFKSRARVHQQAIDKPDNNTRAYLIAYDKYQTFLDRELNIAYKLLIIKLPKAQQTELKKAQRNWIKFRDAEFELIKNNWTRKNFGSSAGISRGTYRCSIIENRVLQLLHYAKNY